MHDGMATFRALKLYPGDNERQEAPLRPRADISLRFLTGHAPVTFDPPPPGDYFDRPIDYRVDPLVLLELQNGVISRDGFIFTEHDELVRESVDRRSYTDRLANRHPDLKAELSALPVEESPETVAILACQRSANYFHWWIDVLARCWLLGNSPYHDVRMVTPKLTHGFQAESLRLLRQEVTQLTRPLQRFRSVVFTRGLTYGSSQDISPLVDEFARWCRATLDLPAAPTRPKLLLSRRSAGSRRILGEDELATALGHDFESVELERMSVREQASLFSSADVVVAPHGAGLTNLLFCERPTAVVELVHKDAPPPYNYRHLAGLLGHPYIAVACASEGPQRDVTRRDLRPVAADVIDAIGRLGQSAAATQ